MNEEEKNTQPEKAGLDDRKKTAILRYVAIMFAIAFLLVLFSLIMQARDTKSTISQLNQTSASALEKVKQLQENYQVLQEEKSALEKTAAELEAQVEELSKRPDVDVDILDTVDALRQELKEAETASLKTREAYDALLTALETRTPGSQEGNVAFSKAMDEVNDLVDYLGEKGLEVYESLTSDAGME